MKKNILAKEFHTVSLLRFAFPTIIMMVFMSMYTMVDGVFVSNFVGEDALSAINIAYPAISVVVAVGIMLASGGSAIIAQRMGEGNNHKAQQDFTFLVVVGILLGIILGLTCWFFADPILNMLGSTDKLDLYSTPYLKILAIFTPFSVLQMLFQFFFISAGRPNLGLWSTIAGGIANIALDYLFIAELGMGIEGAAYATGIGYCIPAIFGLAWFSFYKKGTLFFVKCKADGKMLLQCCFNGSSEMVTNLSTAVTTYLFNIVMLRYMGETGVAAITIVLYSQFLLTAVYLGFSSGVAPVFSFNYGSDNRKELRKLLKICLGIILVSSVLMIVVSMTFSKQIVGIFVKQGSPVFAVALEGFMLFSINYLFAGINIFASSMYTALSNGKLSAMISFLRTFVFILVAIFVLPMIIGVQGVWLAVPLAEFLTCIMAVWCIAHNYNYYFR